MATVNEILKECVANGNYQPMRYHTGDADIQEKFDYAFCTKEDTFRLQTIKGFVECPLNEVNHKILWNRLGDIPTNEDNEIEEPFLHFGVGTETTDIWIWFEWFFDIQLGEVYF